MFNKFNVLNYKLVIFNFNKLNITNITYTHWVLKILNKYRENFGKLNSLKLIS